MNLTIKNLDYQVDEVSLQNLFSPYGPVRSVQIVRDYYTGKATGFIYMLKSKDAISAQKNLQGVFLDDCSLEVQLE